MSGGPSAPRLVLPKRAIMGRGWWRGVLVATDSEADLCRRPWDPDGSVNKSIRSFWIGN